MASSFPSSHVLLSLFVLLLLTFTSIVSCKPSQAYVVYVSKPPRGHLSSLRRWHESFLPNPRSLLYSFRHVISGFTATLTPGELDLIRSKEGFLHAEPDRVLTLDTTHTPSFLGLHPNQNPWSGDFQYGRGVIIGVLDTGIKPTHPSFQGLGMAPPPRKWKVECKFNNTSLCNNKLIGARSFENGVEASSPLDVNGHGTHTSGTAAGRFIPGASVLWSACGTAAGIAPQSHLAMYKVCGLTGCQYVDILAGIDTAVEDGVDVISTSIGGPALHFYQDPILVAAFGAVRKGVFFAASAGNWGPLNGTVRNMAPWFLTVGASTMDRRIRAVARLGNGVELEGESAYQAANIPSYPLVFPRSSEETYPGYCMNQTALERIGVGGKIVLCRHGGIGAVKKSKLVKEAGAAAMILMNSFHRGYDTYAYPFFLPSTFVTYSDGVTIYDYISSASNPTATIAFEGTAIGRSADPAVITFSSRGPSPVNPGILKPDVIGPGVSVLAAWPEPVGPFPLYPPFNFASGTSMSCPHLAGVAALLRSAHPDWSPAMIKSAILTTTDVSNLGGGPIVDLWDKTQADFFEMGAGHVNPPRANNPGLVYDVGADEYISYLCGLGYTDTQVSIVARESVSCSKLPSIDEANLNYPTFVVALLDTTKEVTRVVSNVGEAGTSYGVSVERPRGVTVAVEPETMEFAAAGERQTFTVRFGINDTEAGQLQRPFDSEGFLAWVSSDGKTVVRSPLAVTVGSTLMPFTIGGGSSEVSAY